MKPFITINCRERLRHKYSYDNIKRWVNHANKIINCKSKDELRTIVLEGRSVMRQLVDAETFEAVEDFKELQQRLLVKLAGKKIHYFVVKEITTKGPKGNNITRFFDEVTEQPQDPYDIMDEYSCHLSPNTIKNHKRYDPFRESRGFTKIKNGMIFRLPKRK